MSFTELETVRIDLVKVNKKQFNMREKFETIEFKIAMIVTDWKEEGKTKRNGFVFEMAGSSSL